MCLQLEDQVEHVVGQEDQRHQPRRPKIVRLNTDDVSRRMVIVSTCADNPVGTPPRPFPTPPRQFESASAMAKVIQMNKPSKPCKHEVIQWKHRSHASSRCGRTLTRLESAPFEHAASSIKHVRHHQAARHQTVCCQPRIRANAGV